MSQFLMPSLGADMEAGTLVERLADPGDTVSRGDVIAAVETQKGVIEIEVYEDGTLAEWLVSIGEAVPVGTPLAEILKPGEPAVEPSGPRAARQPSAEPAGTSAPAPQILPKAGAGAHPRVRATPAARRLAARLGLDLKSLEHDPNRPIYRADVPAHPNRPEPASPLDMRAAISAAMARSKREIPHYYLSHTADMTPLEDFLTGVNADRPPQDRILAAAAYVKAVAVAARKYPEFNGSFSDGSFQPAETAHVGLAVRLRGGGLVAPALFDPAAQSLDALMRAIRDQVARVRAGRFKAKELTGATITLSSLGDRGVDRLYGVIYPPQVAIVGIGTPALRPWVYQDKVMPRRTACLTLSADHRASDGHRGALFLNEIGRALQNPEAL